MVYDSMTDAAVSCCEKLDSQLNDLDAVLDMVSTVMASPEASLHMNEAARLLRMSRNMVHRCKDVVADELIRQAGE